MRKLLFFSLLFASFFQIFAQNIDFTEQNFPDKKTLKSALNNINKGNKYYSEKKYSKAIDYFSAAYKINPQNSKLNHAIGKCMFYTNKTSPLPFLLTADKLWNDSEEKSILNFENCLYIAKSYQSLTKYDSAVYFFNKAKVFNTSLESDTLIDNYIMQCHFGDSLSKNPVKVFIDNIGTNVNTDFDEFFPLIDYDNNLMYFNSNRPIGNNEDINSLFVYDISENDSCNNPERVNNIRKIKDNDIICDMSYNGQYLIICRDGNLYIAKKDDDRWSNITKLPSQINTEADESFACFTRNMRHLYFISDRKGGYGGKDIYKISFTVTNNGEFHFSENAENLGAIINSPADEISVSLLQFDNAMYLCSNRTGSIGGYDVFMSLPNGNEWFPPTNLGYPINTVDNELFYKADKDSEHGYLTREDASYNIDIYKVEYPEFENELFIKSFEDTLFEKTIEDDLLTISYEDELVINSNVIASISGTIVDLDTSEPIFANITVIDNNTLHTKGSFTTNPTNGKYSISLPSGTSYSLIINDNEKYLFCPDILHINGSTTLQSYIIDIKLKETLADSIILINDLFFIANSDIIDEGASYPVIHHLSVMLKDNPDIILDLIGEQSKIIAVIERLKETGINKDRLNAVTNNNAESTLSFKIKKKKENVSSK